MALLVFYVALALLVSFACSVMEAVLLSVTPTHVAAMKQKGAPSAHILEGLKKDIDRPLATILSLNTVAHTIGAAGAGAQVQALKGEEYLTLASVVLTLLILIGSEIIPKTLGALYWRSLAPAVARTLVPLILLLWPLVKLSQGITWLFARGKPHATLTRDELAALADLGHRQGVLVEDESRILQSLMAFATVSAREVMTPRTVLFALDESLTIDEVLEAHPEHVFSRIPVYRGNLDTVTGYVLKDEILLFASRGEGQRKLTELRREILVVPETVRLRRLFQDLIKQREPLALVVDEYGGTAGLITTEDVLETLIGVEIVDEADEVDDLQELARRRWQARARELGDPEGRADEDPDPAGPS